MRRRRIGLAIALAALAAGSMAGTAGAADQSVNMGGFAFSPATVTVTEGDAVTWSNGDEVPHTATGSAFDTGTITTGGSASVTFDTAGSFDYVCTIHPAMTGTVVVEAAASGGGGGGGATPPPTDTAPPVTGAPDDPAGTAGAWLLAVLGVAMILGTIAVGRRAEERPASND